MENKEKVQQFLKMLTKLSEETGLIVGGCGCCESPWISDKDGTLLDSFYFNDEKQQFLRRTED